MHAQPRHRFGQGQAAAQPPRQHLQHRRRNVRAARRPDDQHRLAVAHQDHRAHRRHRPRARTHEVGRTALQAKGILVRGGEAEVVHLVVQQHARLRRDETRAQQQVHRVRRGHRQASAVQDRDMTGVVARFEPPRHLGQLRGRRGVGEIQTGVQGLARGGDERFVQGRRRLRHVAGKGQPQHEGSPHRLDQHVRGRTLVGVEQEPGFERVQRLGHRQHLRAAGRGLRHGEGLQPERQALQGRQFLHLVCREIRQGQPAAARLHRLHEVLGDRTAVEGRWALVGQSPQRGRQRRLAQNFTFTEWLASRCQDRQGHGIQDLLREHDRPGQVATDRKAALRHVRRRLRELLPRQAPVLPVQRPQPCDVTRHAD